MAKKPAGKKPTSKKPSGKEPTKPAGSSTRKKATKEEPASETTGRKEAASKEAAASSRRKSATGVRKRRRAAKPKANSAATAKPPAKDTRFKPGQSGNPRGRPRKDRSLLKHLETELDAEMQVTEGGKTMRLSKREAIAKLMVNKSLQGDHKMLAALLKYLPTPKSGESQEQYSVRLETVLSLLSRKGARVSEVDADPDGGSDREDLDGAEGGDEQ